jgi:hypothetical protein
MQPAGAPASGRDALEGDPGSFPGELAHRKGDVGPDRQGREDPALGIEIVKPEQLEAGDAPFAIPVLPASGDGKLESDLPIPEDPVFDLGREGVGPPSGARPSVPPGRQQLERMALDRIGILGQRRSVILQVPIIDLPAQDCRDSEQQNKSRPRFS